MTKSRRKRDEEVKESIKPLTLYTGNKRIENIATEIAIALDKDDLYYPILNTQILALAHVRYPYWKITNIVKSVERSEDSQYTSDDLDFLKDLSKIASDTTKSLVDNAIKLKKSRSEQLKDGKIDKEIDQDDAGLF